MSDPPRVILLDSNAYFRLARTIHPLLVGTFGAAPSFSLYVLSDLDDEYATSTRLRTKFEWVRELQYRRDRAAKRYEYRGKLKHQVEGAFSFLAAYAHEKAVNLSPEDLRALAVGFARGFPVVSDDSGMRQLAEAHGIECWGLVKLLKVMVSGGRIPLEKVQEIFQYLHYENDLPMPLSKLRTEWKNYFGGDMPGLTRAREQEPPPSPGGDPDSAS